MTLKAEDFVVDGLTDDERQALEDGKLEDAAVAADVAAQETADAAGTTIEAVVDAAAKDKAAADATAAKPAADAAAKDGAKDAVTRDAAAKTAGEKKPGDTAAATTDPAKTDAKTDATDEPGTRAQRSAVPDWQAPADAEAKLKAINTQRDALAEKFDAGEISAKDLFAQQRELDGKAREIERAVERAQDAADMTTASWLKVTVPDFLDANPHYRDNGAMHTLLDAEVRRLQVEASKAGKNPLAASILVAADAAINEQLGKMGVQTATPAAGDKKPATETKPGKAQIPPTLAGLPATNIPETDSAFASLDRLASANPEAFETAYAKLTETQREAFLARG